MLFPEIWPRSTALWPPQIRTPIATFNLDLLLNGMSIMNANSGQASESGHVWEWADEMLEAEVLVSSAKPQLPPDMTVAGCVAAVWRIRARQTISDYSFTCAHDRPGSLGSGGPCSGEGLEAQEWRHRGMVLTLGTQSIEEIIAHRQRGGRLPQRLVDANQAFSIGDDLVTYLPNGFMIQPPPLEPREVIQVQFAAAWAAELGDGDVSTWFAVDLAPEVLVGNDGGDIVRLDSPA